MNNESEFKSAFYESVERQKGYTFLISMSIMNGLPDMYCVMPGYIPVLLEAKWFKNIPEIGKFKRKIPYRPLQQHHLTSSFKVVKGSAWCLAGFDCGEKKYCGLVHPEIEIVTDGFLIDPDACVPIVGGIIDIKQLFMYKVPLLQG